MRERYDLTGDALKINGVYIEDEIPGYTTLSASGRESLTKEIVTDESKGDGIRKLYTRYKERVIEVEYLLHSASYDEFVEKYQVLASILSKEDARIIFNNEPDKFLTGSFVFDGDITKEQHARSGKFMIYCHDPFKYSVDVKRVDFENRLAAFDYEGTYKAYPELTVQFPASYDEEGNNTETSEYGYVGFVNSREKMLQFGNPEEVDYLEITGKTFTVINNTFKSFGNWLHANKSQLSRSDFSQTGTAAISGGRVYASGYGSGQKWHGPTVYQSIPSADDGNTGAKNFKWTISHVFKNSAKKQYGGFLAFVLDTTKSPAAVIGGVFLTKTTNDNNCMIYAYAGSASSFKSVKVDCSKVKTTTITKEGGKLTVVCAGKTLTASPSGFESKEGYQVVMGFAQSASKTKISNNYVTKCVFERTKCTYRKEVENTFQPGMTLNIDTADGSILLDDVDARSLGALGNDWEDFYIQSGRNVIAADVTGWDGDAEPKEPVVTISYRERFI